MSSGAAIVFNDPRRFGYMKIIARNALEDEPLLKGLGPEPLGNEFDAAMLARSCHNKKTSLKAALLDQRVVAGLGNIYVCEALFRSHLSPRRLAATLATKKAEPDRSRGAAGRMRSIAVLNQAIKAGGSSISDHRLTSGELGYFQHSFAGLRPRRREVPDQGLRAASCGASSRTAGRPSGARNVRNNQNADATNRATDLAAARDVRCAGHPAPFQQLEHHPASRIGYPWPYPEDGAETFIARELEKVAAGEEIYNWMLVLRGGDGEAIGNIRFRPGSDDAKGNRGFWLAERYLESGPDERSRLGGERFCVPHARDRELLRPQCGDQRASRRVKQRPAPSSSAASSLPITAVRRSRKDGAVTRENWLRRKP